MAKGLTLNVNIGDLEPIKQTIEIMREMVTDERIPEEIRLGYAARLAAVLEGTD